MNAEFDREMVVLEEQARSAKARQKTEPQLHPDPSDISINQLLKEYTNQTPSWGLWDIGQTRYACSLLVKSTAHTRL